MRDFVVVYVKNTTLSWRTEVNGGFVVYFDVLQYVTYSFLDSCVCSAL
jgi:hypothetical protein